MKSQTTTIIIVIILAIGIGVLGYYGYNKYFNQPAPVPTPTPIPENKYLNIQDVSIYYNNQKVTTLQSGPRNYTLKVKLNSSSKDYACKTTITTQKEKIEEGFKDQLKFETNLNPAGEKVIVSLTCNIQGLEKYVSTIFTEESSYGLDKVCDGKNNGEEVTGSIQGIYSDFPLFCYQGFPYNVARICNDKTCSYYNNSFTSKVTFKTKEKIDKKIFQPYFDYVNLTGKYKGFVLLKYNSSMPDQYCAYAESGDGSSQNKYNFAYRNNGETNSTDYVILNNKKYGYNNNSKYFCYNSSLTQRGSRYGCLGTLDGRSVTQVSYTDKKNNTILNYNISQLQFMDAMNYSGCNVCNPQIDSTKLTLYSKGKVGQGVYCTEDGTAINGCMIRGRLYKNKEFTGICTICDSNKNDSQETPADGIRSNNSQGIWCVKGREVVGCNLGNDEIIQERQDRPNYPCQVCFPTTRDSESDEKYVNKPDGIPCGPINTYNINYDPINPLQCSNGLCMTKPTLVFNLNTYQNITGTLTTYNPAFNTTGSVSIQVSPNTNIYSRIGFTYYGELPKKINELYPINQSLDQYYDSKALLNSQRKQWNNSYSYTYTNLFNVTNLTCALQSDGTNQCYVDIPSEAVGNTTTKTTFFLEFKNTLLMLNNKPYYFELYTNPSGITNCTNYTLQQDLNNYGYAFSCITAQDPTLVTTGDCDLPKLSQFAPLCSVFPCKDQYGTHYYLVSQNVYGITKYPDYIGNYTVDKCNSAEECEALKYQRSATVGCENTPSSNTFMTSCSAKIVDEYRNTYPKIRCEKPIFTRDPLNG